MSAELRLLAGLPASASPGAIDMRSHLATHGPAPTLERHHADWLIGALRAAGLAGRGGAAFPAADKLAAIAGARRTVVIANGSESEPMSAKDRVLLQYAPQLVLDGATLVAQVLGASQALIVSPSDTLGHVHAAIAQRGGADGVALRPFAAAPGYIGGEESALIAHLEGRPARPRVKPPMAFERGLNARPTIVHNVETLAQIALIARGGGPASTRLATVSGAVRAPGVYEVATGATLRDIVAHAGGPAQEIRATLSGGYFGTWHEGDGGTATVGGSGVVVALGRSSCGVAEVARVARWMAGQGAGQCGPCINGLDALAGVLERIAGRSFERGDGDRLTRWLAMVRGRGACKHPDGTAAMIASATRVLHAEFNSHARGERCDRCLADPVLATPAEAVAA
jgi:NADH:ubiquinone oxidoreductase subunit F (NADH-binding)